MKMQITNKLRIARYRLCIVACTLFSILIFALLLPVSSAGAQSDQSDIDLILTWRANSFYPSNYTMKAPATPNSRIEVSVTAVKNGKILDLSDNQITWYQDTKYFKRENGLTSINFLNRWRNERPGDEYLITVMVIIDKELFEGSVIIPIQNQEVVIDAPYYEWQVPSGGKIILTATPYFFNVNEFSDFIFYWNVMGDRMSGATDSNTAEINLEKIGGGTGMEIPVSVSAVNSNHLVENTKKRITLFVR